MIGQTLLGFGEAEATEPVSRSFSWIEKKEEARVPGVAAGFGLYKESEALAWR